MIEQIEKLKPDLLALVEGTDEQEQLSNELDQIKSRFKKANTWANNRKKAIEEMEPLSKKCEDLAVPTKETNDEVEDELKIKPRTGVDLKKIEKEQDRVRVRYFLSFYLVVVYFGLLSQTCRLDRTLFFCFCSNRFLTHHHYPSPCFIGFEEET